jgi:uncharacterized protein GlcG (DUF336 family)
LAAIAVFIAGLAVSGHAQTEPRRTSGFPLDFGRPNDGLPLPDGPRGPPPQRAPYARGPSMELALVAAKAAVVACRGAKITVSIIDSAGMPKLYYVPDGTTGYNAYTGFRKAWTALTFKLPTSAVGALTKTDPAVRARIVGDSNFLSFAGGLPIFAKGELIGAIGVSGADPSAIDERCAVAALKKIRSRL